MKRPTERRETFHGRETFWARYFRESETAFNALVFLLPLVIAYELGTHFFAVDPVDQSEQRIIAFSMLNDALTAAGANLRWIAPAAVVCVLMSLAISRREPLTARVTTLGIMLVDSACLALPLLLLSVLMAKVNLLAGPEPFNRGIVLSVGAGIYEEFVFRLLGLAAFHFFFVDFLGIRPTIGAVVAVVGCGVLFSLYHYWGSEAFSAQTFVFRTLAGCYFGIVMLHRGFGVTVGCHIIYDLVVCGLVVSPVHRT